MPVPDWFPDELVFAGVEHLDPGYVAGYDAKSQTDHREDVASLLRNGITEDSVVLDLGAGTGTFALTIAPYVAQVIAIDISPAMLAMLRHQVDGRNIRNIRTAQGGFLSYEHVGPAVDAVYSRNALHHLSDFWKGIALERIARMLRPGGVLRLLDLVYDFDPRDANVAIETWLAGAQPSPLTGWTRQELAAHLRTEHSTYRWLLEPLLERTGFTIVEVVYRRGVYGSYTCVKPY